MSSSHPIHHREFYDYLEVESTASTSDIMKAYRRKALKMHPDRGGDAEQFKRLGQITEVLKNDRLRQIYNTQGQAGVEEAVRQSASQSQNKQSAGTGVSASESQDGSRLILQVEVYTSLETIYVGATQRATFACRRICEACKGCGTRDGSSCICVECKGTKITTMQRPIGPNMMQLIQVSCQMCKGTGKQLKPDNTCATCEGEQITSQSRHIDFEVPRGCPSGYRIMFSQHGEGLNPNAPDQYGDVVIVVIVQPHALYTREHNNLYIKHRLTLEQTLLGFQFNILRLDNTVLNVVSDSQTVIRPGTIMAVKNEGMPDFKEAWSDTRGTLLIEFDVEFPSASKCLVPQIRQLLHQALSDGKTMPYVHSAILPANGAQCLSVDADKERELQVQLKHKLMQEMQQEHPEAYIGANQTHQNKHQQHNNRNPFNDIFQQQFQQQGCAQQ